MRAAEGLSILKIPLLGAVVNRVGAEHEGDYYGYGGGYGYGYREEERPPHSPPDEIPQRHVA